MFQVEKFAGAKKGFSTASHSRSWALRGFIAQLPPCTIGMEACTGAVSIPPSRRLDADCLPLVHHWARLFRQHGHTVKLMAPKLATPYRMTGRRGKNYAADAAAICEAVTFPHDASSGM